MKDLRHNKYKEAKIRNAKFDRLVGTTMGILTYLLIAIFMVILLKYGGLIR